MSIMRMRKFFSKPLKVGKSKRTIPFFTPAGIVFVLLIVVLLVGTYYSFGPPSRAAGDGSPVGPKLTANVATIDGKPITRQQYAFALEMARRSMGDQLDATQMRYIKSSVLDGLIDRQLKETAVKKQRINITKAEIEAFKDGRVEEIKQQRYSDTRELRDYLERRNMSLEQLDESIRNNLPDDDIIKVQLQFDRLQEQVEAQVTMTDTELEESFTEVSARHILITTDYMQRKAEEDSSKAEEPAADEPAEDADASVGSEGAGEADDAPTTELEAKITEEQAKQQARDFAEELLSQLQGGADFAKLAEEHSQDFASATEGGDLGWFKRGRMVPEFEKAAFGTAPGQLSGVVETDYGFHIIKVEETRKELPEDFTDQKEMYREQAMAEAKMRVWREYEQALRDNARIDIIDPELKAYDLLNEGNKIEGMAALEAAIEQDAYNVTALYELAQLHEETGMLDSAIDLLTKVTTTELGARSPQARFRLAELHEANGNTEGAIEEYKSAADWAAAFTQGNYMMHMRLRAKFEELEQEDLVEQEQEWIDDYLAHQSEMGFGGGMPFTFPGQ